MRHHCFDHASNTAQGDDPQRGICVAYSCAPVSTSVCTWGHSDEAKRQARVTRAPPYAQRPSRYSAALIERQHHSPRTVAECQVAQRTTASFLHARVRRMQLHRCHDGFNGTSGQYRLGSLWACQQWSHKREHSTNSTQLAALSAPHTRGVCKRPHDLTSCLEHRWAQPVRFHRLHHILDATSRQDRRVSLCTQHAARHMCQPRRRGALRTHNSWTRNRTRVAMTVHAYTHSVASRVHRACPYRQPQPPPRESPPLLLAGPTQHRTPANASGHTRASTPLPAPRMSATPDGALECMPTSQRP